MQADSVKLMVQTLILFIFTGIKLSFILKSHKKQTEYIQCLLLLSINKKYINPNLLILFKEEKKIYNLIFYKLFEQINFYFLIQMHKPLSKPKNPLLVKDQ